MSVSFTQLASARPQVIAVPAAAFETLTTNSDVLAGLAAAGVRNPHQRSPVAPTSEVHGGPASSSTDRPWNTSEPVGAADPAVLPVPPVLPPAPPPTPVLPPVPPDPPRPPPPSGLD